MKLRKICLLLLLCIFATNVFAGCEGILNEDDEEIEEKSEKSDVSEKSEESSNEDQESSQINEDSSIVSEEASDVSEETAEDPYQRDKQIYTNYLLNGGYEEIGPEYADAYDVKSVMADLESDGTYELLIYLANKDSVGIQGPERTTTLLTIKDGTPVELVSAYHCGGSMGGESMYITLDTDNNRLGVQRVGLFKGGYDYSLCAQDVFVADNNYSEPIVELCTVRIYEESNIYNEDIENIKAQTDLHYVKDGFFCYYTIDGEFVYDQNHLDESSIYENQTEGEYALKEATYSQPIA